MRRISPCLAPPSRSRTPKPTRRARRRATRPATTTFPNVAAGTYRVDVTLPGFQIVPRAGHRRALNAAVRVDAKLTVGALQESVLVSADAVLLQTETAAVQTQTTSQQLQNLPINGRSFQSMLTLTPGVAQPNYFQTGGINNPARVDAGVGQRRAELEHRVPSRRRQRDEPVDSGPAGLHAGHRSDRDGQRRHQQLRRRAGHGRRRVGERADQERHEHAARLGVRVPDSHDKLRSRNYFLPADQEKTKDNKSVFGGTIGGPIKRDKVFYFVSVESHDAADDRRAVCERRRPGSASQFLSLPPAAIRSRQLLGHRHGHLRSGDRQ